MARTQSPLFSARAHGTIAKNLTYSTTLAAQLTRWQKKNRDANSAAQTTARGKFNDARTHWNQLTAAQREEWNDWNDAQ